MIAFPNYFKSHKKGSAIVAISVMFLVFIGFVGSSFNLGYLNSSSNHENMGISGWLTIKVDNKIVYDKPDLITYLFYTYNMCKLFNDTSNACGGTNLSIFYNYPNCPTTCADTNGCTTYSIGGTANKPSHFSSSTRCTATAIFLSTDTDAPITGNPSLSTYITTNGLSPVHGVTSYVVASNSITLTGTWTASANVNGIDKVGIGLWNDATNTFVGSTPHSLSQPLYVLTSDIFTTQSLNSGQTFQVIFTISF